MRRFMVHLVTRLTSSMATKRQTRRRRTTRSISPTLFGTRRRGSHFGRSETSRVESVSVTEIKDEL